MVIIEPTYMSCGVIQLDGIDDETDVFEKVYKHWGLSDPEMDEDGFSQVVFSDATVLGNGEELVRTIRREKLGDVVAGPVTVNPNSLNEIQVWIWAPDFDALGAYV